MQEMNFCTTPRSETESDKLDEMFALRFEKANLAFNQEVKKTSKASKTICPTNKTNVPKITKVGSSKIPAAKPSIKDEQVIRIADLPKRVKSETEEAAFGKQTKEYKMQAPKNLLDSLTEDAQYVPNVAKTKRSKRHSAPEFKVRKSENSGKSKGRSRIQSGEFIKKLKDAPRSLMKKPSNDLTTIAE